ncbi:YbaB/EbfC family DNA-binding protein [Amycolatopsis sp. WQ 127309]|uniref:YbaB/EbfC family DNA-binding protein n=1 Tax=Amycolatopsis sp. WQ 127309 TaxID=2932773 RepID=UPI001FF354DF|nr:YbaB/EbfC family DNA-binding protein [Amycolatopsis sp. WQ 127309]UOZ06954.1 YbaB/EbfC family DNA-binding protein [Amycolatopsis sp. WQ 127309]
MPEPDESRIGSAGKELMVMSEWDSPVDAERALEKAMADLDSERRKLSELGRVWRDEKTTIKSKDQSLSMTFDGRGDLVDLVFNESKYRALPPAQLASVLLETLRRGRAQSMTRMSEVMGLGERTGGMDLSSFASGDFDPEKLIGSLLGPMYEKMDDFGVPMPGRDAPRRQEG